MQIYDSVIENAYNCKLYIYSFIPGKYCDFISPLQKIKTTRMQCYKNNKNAMLETIIFAETVQLVQKGLTGHTVQRKL